MDGGGVAKEKYEHQLVIKTQKIRELVGELAVSKKFAADFMLNVNSDEQQVRKIRRGACHQFGRRL
jgi:hypothetical protein